MIKSFKNHGTDDVFNRRDTKAARAACPAEIVKVARRKLDQLDSVTRLDDLRVPPGNQLEKLVGNRAGQYSIRINQQHRICFDWNDGPENVEITDYH